MEAGHPLAHLLINVSNHFRPITMTKKITLGTILFIVALVSFSFINSIPIKEKPINPSTIKNLGWKIGLQLYSFKEHPFATATEMAKASGVTFVEAFTEHKMGKDFNDSSFGKLDEIGISKLQQMMKENNLKMSSIYANNPKSVRDWDNYFKIGVRLGIKYIVCEPRKKDLNILDSLSTLYGIKVAIHEHAKGESAYWHPDSVLAVIKGRKNFGACADIGHWARSGLDPVACLKMLEGHIIGVHAKDINEFGNVKAKNVESGKGVIDFNAVYKELQRQRFKGVVHIECEYNFENNLQDVINARSYLLGLKP
jgi:sugar phosphate isomerase/epimerase